MASSEHALIFPYLLLLFIRPTIETNSTVNQSDNNQSRQVSTLDHRMHFNTHEDCICDMFCKTMPFYWKGKYRERPEKKCYCSRFLEEKFEFNISVKVVRGILLTKSARCTLACKLAESGFEYSYGAFGYEDRLRKKPQSCFCYKKDDKYEKRVMDYNEQFKLPNDLEAHFEWACFRACNCEFCSDRHMIAFVWGWRTEHWKQCNCYEPTIPSLKIPLPSENQITNWCPIRD